MGSPDQNENARASPALELSAHQASLAFERTLMSADRTLMAAIQTSLALIGFGFAMFLFFHQAGDNAGVNLRTPARNFGLSLVAMGIGLVAVGLIDHRRRFTGLRTAMDGLHRKQLLLDGFLHRRSYTSVLAVLLLLSGLFIILGIVVRVGPFG